MSACVLSEGLTTAGAGESTLLTRPCVGEPQFLLSASEAIPALEVLAVGVASRSAELPPLLRIRYARLASELIDGWFGCIEGAQEFARDGHFNVPDLVMSVLIQELALEYAGNRLGPCAANSAL